MLVSDSACLFSESNEGGGWTLVVSGGSGARLSNGNELCRNKRDGQSSTHTVNHICINAYCFLMLANFPKPKALESASKLDFVISVCFIRQGLTCKLASKH